MRDFELTLAYENGNFRIRGAGNIPEEDLAVILAVYLLGLGRATDSSKSYADSARMACKLINALAAAEDGAIEQPASQAD